MGEYSVLVLRLDEMAEAGAVKGLELYPPAVAAMAGFCATRGTSWGEDEAKMECWEEEEEEEGDRLRSVSTV